MLWLLALTALWAVAVAACDLRRRRCPNCLALTAAAAGIALLSLTGETLTGSGPGDAGLAVAFGALLTLPGYLSGGLGAGDVKLVIAMALLGGLQPLLGAFVMGGVFTAAYALARRARRTNAGQARVRPSRRPVPLGAGLAVGFCCVVLAGAVGTPA